jgi:transcription-repair coupling factor (superfamily II helicase)
MTTELPRPDRSALRLEGPSGDKHRPVLYALVRELLRMDRFQDFASALPTRARVSEPVLPLLLAALHEQLDRAVSVLVPEDADARDVAEAASWYVGAERVALLPSRGVRWDSGLRPPPHLVGERARALDVLEQGGLVVVSATALAEGMPPAAERPAPIRLQPGEEHGLETLTEELALAGYERVERAEERGQFAVRGDLVDVFPTTGREPLRVEFFGDEIEQVRAFSPFTQRALHDVDDAFVYPAGERRAELVELELSPDDDEPPRVPNDLVSPLRGGPDLVWEPQEVREVWVEEGLAPVSLAGVTELEQLPAAQPFAFEAQRPAIAARGLSEAENELSAFVRAGHRVVVAFPHRGEALRTQNLLRRVEADLLEEGQILIEDPQARFAISPARRGFVWRDLNLVLLPDTQVFRRRAPRPEAARIGRALQSFADLRTGDYVVHEDHGVGKLLGFETKTVAGVTRDYLFLAFRGEDRLYVPHEQIGKVSRYIGTDARAPALSKLGGKAWQNLKTRARESVRELAGELLALYAQRQSAPGVPYDLRNEWLQRLEAEFPYRETPDQERAIEEVKEDLEAPPPMDRLDCGDVGFGKT